MTSQGLPDRIAESSISLYDSLPKHGKPIVRDNGVPEWTILSVISLVLPFDGASATGDNAARIVPVSLGTGVKVLPHARLPPLGDALHDCHGEVLARRGFVRWLIRQALILTKSENGLPHEHGTSEEIYVERAHDGRVRMRDGISVWLYVSALPCGDASTMYTAAHQAAEEASQWSQLPVSPPNPNANDSSADLVSGVVPQPLRGRRTYSSVASLRTKPGRPDSPPTTSMSCSDKIALWTCLGLQGGLLGSLFERIKLDGIVVGGVEVPAGWQGNHVGWEENVKGEVHRALLGRLDHMGAHLPHEFLPVAPQIHITTISFSQSKPSILAIHPSLEVQPSPLSLSYLPWLTVQARKGGLKPAEREIISGGTIVGFLWKTPGEILVKPKGRSRICKYEILKAYDEVVCLSIGHEARGKTYYSYKHPPNSQYQRAKTLLRGDVAKTRGVGVWAKLGDIKSTVPNSDTGLPVPPFTGWLVSGEEFESYEYSCSADSHPACA